MTQRFATVRAWLLRRLSDAPSIDAGVSNAVQLLAATRGKARIATLQEASGVSRVRFHELFRTYVASERYPNSPSIVEQQ